MTYMIWQRDMILNINIRILDLLHLKASQKIIFIFICVGKVNHEQALGLLAIIHLTKYCPVQFTLIL